MAAGRHVRVWQGPQAGVGAPRRHAWCVISLCGGLMNRLSSLCVRGLTFRAGHGVAVLDRGGPSGVPGAA